MRLRNETTFGVGTLLALQLLTAFGAIGLLARVSPAAEQILRENVYSTEAVEEMLVTLAAGGPEQPVDAGRYRGALRRAEGNVTEDAERPQLAILRDQLEPTLAGDPAARQETLQALQQLSAINRASMRSADEAAQRIGVTGAWAAVILGSISFFLGAGVYRRLRARLEAPILQLDAALDAARSGDSLRRCPSSDSPEELVRITRNLNWLLDHVNRPDPAADPSDRLALLALMDSLPYPVRLRHPDHGVLASNTAALDRADLSGDDPGWVDLPVRDSVTELRLWRPTEAGEE